MNQNHANFEGRLAFIRNVLRERFGGENAKIDPLQYDPECPFKYNNFVYRITLDAPPSAARENSSNETRQPGTAPLPEGAKEFIMRLTNPDAEGMHAHTRVENEVAIISLAAAALRGWEPHVVPSVYAWGSAAPPSSQGWILQELMPGESVSEAFQEMSLEEKQSILSQMARILKDLQDYKLSNSITQYGGVTFDEAGQIVSTAMTSVGSGPWPSFEAYFRDRLERALQQADSNPYIEGWHANGVRKRLDVFVKNGVPTQFKALEHSDKKSIVHADFTPDNLLYDPSTQRITALIDYDFACILHPSYEFLRSFSGAGGQFQGWSDIESTDQTALRDAKLNGLEGFDDSKAPQDKDVRDKWKNAREKWEDARKEWQMARQKWEDAREKREDPVLEKWEDALKGWEHARKTWEEALKRSEDAREKWDDAREKWTNAKAWEKELERHEVMRPSTIKGIKEIADVDAVLRCILPWRVTNSDILRLQSEAVILKCRHQNEAQLVNLLDHLGVVAP